ncbi:MAG: hypothetical protein KJ922_04205, partial [Nanoarchaeota archaeon]|nr:hypothetical protein [Nanoarchaeota archaeon]
MKKGFFEKRYESVRKRLGLPKEVDKKKKLLIIQIDALSHSTLLHLMDKGYCRFLKKLISNKDYHLQKYNCGIPSGTPSIQSAIMYGDNSKVPGFRYIDKKRKMQISFGTPHLARYVEKKYFSGKKGILKGGSSYSNHF